MANPGPELKLSRIPRNAIVPKWTRRTEKDYYLQLLAWEHICPQKNTQNLRVISISHSLPLHQQLLWAGLKIRLLLYSVFHPDDPSLVSCISTAAIHVSLAEFSQFSFMLFMPASPPESEWHKKQTETTTNERRGRSMPKEFSAKSVTDFEGLCINLHHCFLLHTHSLFGFKKNERF